MEREKASNNWPNKNEKESENCPSDYQRPESEEKQTNKGGSVKKEFKRPSLSEQRIGMLHSISKNINDDRMLHDEPMSDLFFKRNNWCRQKILELLHAVTLETLFDFQEFSKFIKTSLIRIEYQCNSMLYHFLCVAAESMDSETDTVSHADFLVETLSREINSMNDAVAVSATILDVNRNYEWGLADTFFEEETP